MVEQVFLQVLNMSLKAGIVILCVLVARLALRRAPKVFSYALWSVVLLRLLCPVSLTWAFSLLPTRAEPIPMDIMYAQQPKVFTGIPPVDSAVNAVLPAPVGAASVNPLQIWTLLGGLVWLAGMAALALYSLIALARLLKRLKAAVPGEEGVWLLDGLETPFVLGLFRPRIYLPSGLGAEERRYILLHERTHIRRGDHVLRIVAFAALCLHWFNPLVWLAFFLSGRDMEMSCDERVLRELGNGVKQDYSSSLLSLATGRRWVGGTPLAFGEGDTGSRIKNVLRWKKPAFWVMAAAAALVLALCLCLAADREEQDLSFLNPDNLIPIVAQRETAVQIAEYEPSYYQYLSGPTVARWIDETEWDRLPSAQPFDYEPTYELLDLTGGGERSVIRLYREAPDRAMVFYGADRFRCYRISGGAFDTLEGMLRSISFAQPFGNGRYEAVTMTEHDAGGAKASVTITDPSTVRQLESLTAVMDAYRPNGRGGPVPTEHIFLSFTGDGVRQNYFLYPREDRFYLQTAEVGEWEIPQERAQTILELFRAASERTPEAEIPRLIDVLTANRMDMMASSSVPVPEKYLRIHEEQFSNLLAFGDDTLRYCFTRFAAGGETGLEGHIMMMACRALCADEDIDLAASNGQEWFDAFHQSALADCERRGVKEFAQMRPKAYLLLELLGEVPESE